MQDKTHTFINNIKYIILNLFFIAIAYAQVTPYKEPLSFHSSNKDHIVKLKKYEKVVFSKNKTIQQYKIDIDKNSLH